MFGLAGQLDRDALALEDQHEVGKRYFAVGGRGRADRSSGASRIGVSARSRRRRANPAGQPAGSAANCASVHAFLQRRVAFEGAASGRATSTLAMFAWPEPEVTASRRGSPRSLCFRSFAWVENREGRL